MSDFESLSGALPPPRDDEPANLRQDILDELRDHLGCALRREQLTGGLEGAAGRTIEKFGDPAAVARRLWRDALWEKIMSQRLMLALCVVMTLVCCAALGVTALWLNRQDVRMKEQSELFSKLLANSEASTKQLSDQLKQAQQAAEKSQPFSEWNPVELKFVSGSKDGPPVAGVKVSLHFSRSGEAIPTMEKISDENGIARFERAKYGAAYINYEIKFSDKTSYYSSKHISLLPGEPFHATIVCPATTPTPTPVTIQIDWPDAVLARKPLLTFIGDSFAPAQPIEGESWQINFPVAPLAPPLQSTGGFLGGGGGGESSVTCAAIDSRGQADIAEFTYIQDPIRSVRTDNATKQFFSDFQIVDVKSRSNYTDALRWPGPDYRLRHATILLDGIREPISRIFTSPTTDNPARPGRDSLGFGFGRRSSGDDSTAAQVERCRLSFHVDMTNWNYELSQSNPAILKLTPSQASIDSMQAAIARIDSKLAEMVKEADERQALAEKELALWEQNAPQRAAEAERKKPFSEWNPVEFRFVEETSGGPPVASLPVQFTARGNDFPAVQTKTDADGRVRFDRVRYGNYTLSADDEDRGHMRTSITILPGEGLNKSFVFPKQAQPFEATVRVNWPKEFKARPIGVALLDGEFQRVIEGCAPNDPSCRFTLEIPKWEQKFFSERGGLPLTDFKYSQAGVAGFTCYWLDDSKVRDTRVNWPGREWKPVRLTMFPQFSESAAKSLSPGKSSDDRKLYALGARLDVKDWSLAWEGTSPPTAVLTPDESAIEHLRSLETSIKSAEQSLIDRKP